MSKILMHYGTYGGKGGGGGERIFKVTNNKSLISYLYHKDQGLLL